MNPFSCLPNSLNNTGLQWFHCLKYFMSLSLSVHWIRKSYQDLSITYSFLTKLNFYFHKRDSCEPKVRTIALCVKCCKQCMYSVFTIVNCIFHFTFFVTCCIIYSFTVYEVWGVTVSLNACIYVALGSEYVVTKQRHVTTCLWLRLVCWWSNKAVVAKQWQCYTSMCFHPSGKMSDR
jgi:hypothetical protein